MCRSIPFQFKHVNFYLFIYLYFGADTLYKHPTDHFYMDLQDTLSGRHEDQSLTDKGTEIQAGQ